MKKFRENPVVIEAIQYDGDNLDEILEIGNHDIIYVDESMVVQVKTPEGELSLSHGNWLMRNVEGILYPCQSDIFEDTYEEV